MKTTTLPISNSMNYSPLQRAFTLIPLELKKKMKSVIARSKEQEAKIQRVSDQVQMSSPAVRVILSDQ